VKKLLLVLFASLICVTTAHAQNAVNGQTTSNSTANQTAASDNQGVYAGVNQYGATHERVESTVPVSAVGYGSFSQSSCMTSVGGGLSLPAAALVYNGPKADINCQHVVLGDAFGRAAQLAASLKANDMAVSSLSMVFYTYCTSDINDDNLVKSCIDKGLVVPTGTTHDVKVSFWHHRKVEDVRPAINLPADVAQYLNKGPAADAAKTVQAPQPAAPQAPAKPMDQQAQTQKTMHDMDQMEQELADSQAAKGPVH
jgi:hypothetical protein